MKVGVVLQLGDFVLKISQKESDCFSLSQRVIGGRQAVEIDASIVEARSMNINKISTKGSEIPAHDSDKIHNYQDSHFRFRE